MNKKQGLKLIGYFVGAVLILNLVLFALRVISLYVFWGIIILGALVAYLVLPRLKI